MSGPKPVEGRIIVTGTYTLAGVAKPCVLVGWRDGKGWHVDVRDGGGAGRILQGFDHRVVRGLVLGLEQAAIVFDADALRVGLKRCPSLM